jgi:hypothetical protein
MSTTLSPTQSEFSEGSPLVKPSVEVPTIGPADLKNDRLPSARPSLGRRAPLALARFLITFCIGVAATLAWQSYGDAARAMIANSSPQLGWLAPQAAPVGQTAPDMIAQAMPAAPSPDQQQLHAMSLDLDAVRQSVDRIATSIAASQEQITRSVDRIVPVITTSQEQIMHSVERLTAGQEQMTREIAKLQAVDQVVLHSSPDPSPRLTPAPVTKPALRPSQKPTAPTPAKNP